MDKTLKGTRLEFIDIAKGILIMCMLFGHINVYGPMDGVQDICMNYMSYPCVIFSAFFMQAFFIITGYCSTFNVDFKVFLWKNVKMLLLPSILLFLISEFYKLIVFSNTINLLPFYKLTTWVSNGAPWFIMAMFWAKLLYWFICRLAIKWQIIILSVFYIGGLIVHQYFEFTNYFWFKHTLLMTPYLLIGNQIKTKNILDNGKLLKVVSMVFIISIVAQFALSYLSDYVIPSQDHSICISLSNFPIHIINSVLGTICILWISKRIAKCHFLSVLGTGTLLIYLWNGIVYRSIVKLLYPLYNPNNLVVIVLFHIIALLMCYVVFYFVVRLIYSHKSWSWVVGKW